MGPGLATTSRPGTTAVNAVPASVPPTLTPPPRLAKSAAVTTAPDITMPPVGAARRPLVMAAATLPAQVTYERIRNADREPSNWLTYSGGYSSLRYSLLKGTE